MTYYKCPNCAGETERENKVMVICPCCQIEMKPYPYKKEKIVEVFGDGSYRSESETD